MPALSRADLGGSTGPGGISTLSGTGPASGVSGVGSFSGPFYVEEQQLTINYKRVPFFKFGHGSLNLSAGNLNPEILATHLIESVLPLVIKRKVYDWYETSSYLQLQRFSVYSTSEDYTGMTYGEPAAGALGVAGLIITTQPYYFRRDWTDQDTIDSASWNSPGVSDFGQFEPNPLVNCQFGAVSRAKSYRPFNSHDCFIDALIDPDNGGWGQTHHPFDPTWLGSVTYWDTIAGATVGDTRAQVLNTNILGTAESCTPSEPYIKTHGLMDNHQLGWKSGAYDAAQDTITDVQPYVDTIADIIAKPFDTGNLASIADPSDYFVYGDGSVPFGSCQGIFAVNNVAYDKSRHYWGN
tara:strand:+ start:222 stop:1280 length:1059 start_codon:yes stop_codon:yes gene_type:complete